MASPTVAGSIATQSITVGSTPVTVTLPSSIAAGERLVAVLAWDNGNNVTITPTIDTGVGWSIKDNTNTTAVNSMVLEKLSASGDSADTLVVSFSGWTIAELGVAIVLRIATHTSGSALEIAQQSHTDVGDGSISATPDPPSLTPSWGSDDTLFIVVAAWDNASRTVSSYPTNYDSNQLTNLGAGTSATVGAALATRAIAGAAENPGTFTISATDQWDAYTIAIRGTGGGGGDPTLSSAEFVADGSTTGDAEVTTDVAGGTLYVVLTESATTPSDAQIMAGQDHTGAAAAFADDATATSGVNTFPVTGLDPSTEYWPHFHQDQGAGDTITGTSDTTDAAPSGPTIDTQPSNQTVTEPNEATFTVAATTSGGTLTYQWQEDDGGGFSNLSNGGSYSGVTTATLSIDPTDTDLTGYEYRCNVTDDNGTTTSSAATLTVNAASTNDIRLQPSMLLERGAYAASRTVSRWWVLTADLTAVAHTGTSAATNSTGQPTIDIVGSVYEVGDNVPMMFSEWTTETSELDRTTRGTPIIWVPAIAIP